METQPGGAWHPARRLLTAGLLLTVSATAFEALAVATVLPTAVEEIGGIHLYGWAFSAFMLTNLLGISIAGQIADERGPALPFVVGTVLFTAGLLLAGIATMMPLVIAGRAAQGLGAGAISAVAYVAVARAYPSDDQPHMLALLSSAWVVPGLIGPALAGAIAVHFHWRWVFLGLAPLMLGAAGLAVPALRRLPAVVGKKTVAPRGWAALRLAVGSSALILGLEMQPVLLGAGVAIAGLALAVPAFVRLTPPGTLRASPGLGAAVASMGLLSLAFFGAEAFLPLALTTVRGQSTLIAGAALTAATLSWTGGAWIQARVVKQHSRRRLTTIGLVLVAAGITGIATALLPDAPVLPAILAWGLSGLGIGVAYSTIALTVLESAPPGREGEASAAMQLASGLGIALGTGAGGAAFALLSELRSQSIGIGVVDLIAVAAALVGVAAAQRLP